MTFTVHRHLAILFAAVAVAASAAAKPLFQNSAILRDNRVYIYSAETDPQRLLVYEPISARWRDNEGDRWELGRRSVWMPIVPLGPLYREMDGWPKFLIQRDGRFVRAAGQVSVMSEPGFVALNVVCAEPMPAAGLQLLENQMPDGFMVAIGTRAADIVRFRPARPIARSGPAPVQRGFKLIDAGLFAVDGSSVVVSIDRWSGAGRNAGLRTRLTVGRGDVGRRPIRIVDLQPGGDPDALQPVRLLGLMEIVDGTRRENFYVFEYRHPKTRGYMVIPVQDLPASPEAIDIIVTRVAC